MKNSILYLSVALFFLSCREEKKVNAKQQTENPYYDKAWDFVDQHLPDSAFSYFNQAQFVFLKAKDSVGTAKSLCNMSIIAFEAGDFFGGQELSLESIKYLDTLDQVQREIASSNYTNLGNIANALDNYDEALTFFKQALSLTKNQHSKELYHNNIGINLSYLKKYDDAINYLNWVIRYRNSGEYARALSNLGKVKWLKDPNYNPIPLFYQALAIRKEKSDRRGQNASYAHLSDYYAAKKQTDSALKYAQEMFAVAKSINSPDDQLEALQKLVKLSPDQSSKSFFAKYQKLNDSVQVARNSAKNQFVLIRYQTEKLKANGLALQKDNAAKNYQILLLITGTVLLCIIGVFWYRKRKQRLALEAQNAIRENQLKTSKKVHDVVANGLYRVMTELENQEGINKEKVIDRIEELYEKSRDISYEEVFAKKVDFVEKIAILINSFVTKSTHISIHGNSDLFWSKTSDFQKQELEHILQELLVNMKKHSNATEVALGFEQRQENMLFIYIDNGVGMDIKTPKKNGLTNTGNRIKTMKGAINFGVEANGGLKIEISFPVFK